MEEVMADPKGTKLPLQMNDQRWPGSQGWVKMSQTVNGVEIHWVENTITGAVDDFKFK
jgi:filamentous hemagglutinin